MADEKCIYNNVNGTVKSTFSIGQKENKTVFSTNSENYIEVSKPIRYPENVELSDSDIPNIKAIKVLIDSTSDNDYSLEFNGTMTYPLKLFNANNNSIIKKCTIIINESFGDNTLISIGTADNNNLVYPAEYIQANMIGSFEIALPVLLNSDDELYLYISGDNINETGNGIILLEF